MDVILVVAVCIAIPGWVVATLEFVQLYLQRKVLIHIDKKLDTIDVDKTIASMTANTTAAVSDLKASLLEMVERLPTIFGESIHDSMNQFQVSLQESLAKLPEVFADKIQEYGANIDSQTLIDSLAGTIVARAIEAAPLMAEGLASQVMTEGKAAMGMDPETIKMMDEHPVGSFIALAMAATARRQPPGTAQQQQGRRQI